MALLIQPLGTAALKNVTLALKTSDQSINSSTTLADCTSLSFPILANETWYFSISLAVICDATGQSKFGFTIPAGATGGWFLSAQGAGTGYLTGNTIANPISVSTTLTATSLNIFGTIINSSTAGTVQLQFAQAVSSGTDTTVKGNSFLQTWRITP